MTANVCHRGSAEDSMGTSIDGDQTDAAAVDAGAVYVFHGR